MRELRNVIERACILADGEWITERELAGSMAAGPVAAAGPARAAAHAPAADPDLLSTVEREHIRQALQSWRQREGRGAHAGAEPPRALPRLERLDLHDAIRRRGALAFQS